MIGPRNLRPDELGEAEGFELHDALRTGEQLLDAMDDAPIQPSPDFADGVMAAITAEPIPGTAGFLVPLRHRGVLGGFGASVREAWASVRGNRPMLGRSAALAYVLTVAIAGASLTGAAALGAGAALGLLDPSPTSTETPVVPAPTIAPPPIVPSPSPNAVEPTVEPPVEPSPSPSETPDDSEEPEQTDDNGNSGPGGGGDGGNSGPGGGDDGGNSGPGGGDDDDNSGPGGGGSGSSGSGSGGSGSSGSGSGEEGSR